MFLTILSVICCLSAVHAETHTDCGGSYLSDVMRLCRSSLSQMVSSILHTRTDNYTQACRHFETYVLCVHPNVAPCQSAQLPDRLMTEYYLDLNRYTSLPFNCTIPSTAHLTRNIFPTPNTGPKYGHIDPQNPWYLFPNTATGKSYKWDRNDTESYSLSVSSFCRISTFWWVGIVAFGILHCLSYSG